MSQWKIDLKSLYDQGGGPLPTARIENGVLKTPIAGMRRARSLGLVTGKGGRGSQPMVWTITKLGRDYIEGKVVLVNNYRRGIKDFFVPNPTPEVSEVFRPVYPKPDVIVTTSLLGR